MPEAVKPEATNDADAVGQSAEEPSAAVRDVLPSLEEQLRNAEQVAQEHHDAWLRARAEVDNMRKRAAQDVDQARKFAIEGFAGELLAVKDSLEAALGAESSSIENLRDGVELTLKQLSNVFDRHRLVELNPMGEKFDPHRHQAIGMQASDAEPNTVVAVLQKGYLLHERVIRPALVMVAQKG